MPRRKHLDTAAVDAFIASRNGVVTTRELDRLGVSRSTVAYRTRAQGPWQRLLPGVVLTFTGPVRWVQRLTAALRYAGAGAMLTGVSALRRYGLRHLPVTNEVHVLVPHRRRRASTAFVIIERTTRLPDHRTNDGLPCAPIERAAMDAARRLTDLDTVRAMIAEVVQSGRSTVSALSRELREGPVRGTALPRRVLREVADGVRSVAEAQVRTLLRQAGVPMPLWNCDVYDAQGRWLCRPDAVWPALGVVLEIDSIEWHLSPAEYRKTQARHRRMTKAGLLVVHIAPSDARDLPKAFVAELLETLATAASRPAPLITLRPAAA